MFSIYIILYIDICVCFFFRQNERHAIFPDCIDFDNRQLGAFVDVSFGLHLFITETSKSTIIIIIHRLLYYVVSLCETVCSYRLPVLDNLSFEIWIKSNY